MAAKEAQARIKINKLLEEVGWRFFDNANGKANIILEPKVKLTKAVVDAVGENFEETGKGFIDFLLLDDNGFPLLVLEAIHQLHEEAIGAQGMKIDPTLQQHVENEQWDQAIDYVTNHLFDKPSEFYTLDKLRRAAGVDRRLTLREILEITFGLIPYFKNKDELLEDEFQKFILDQSPDALGEHTAAIVAMKYFFKAYATDGRLRDIVESKRLTDLNVNPAFSMADFKAVPKEWRDKIPEYLKDYVTLNQFM
jgi:hypothetical protein